MTLFIAMSRYVSTEHGMHTMLASTLHQKNDSKSSLSFLKYTLEAIFTIALLAPQPSQAQNRTGRAD